MADWIKVRDNLVDDPTVGRICIATKLDKYAVVGRLVKLWAWADQYTTDGNADVTLGYVDSMLDCLGFADALVLVHWLEVPENGRIRIPNFERHNGKSAKKRALTANRVQAHRSNAPVTQTKRISNAERVTREEKSSSSNKHPTVTTGTSTAPPPQTSTPVEETPRSTPTPASPAVAIAADGFPTEGVAAFAKAHGVRVRKPQPADFEP